MKQIARTMRHNNKLESEEHNMTNENNLNPETGELPDDELNHASGGKVVPPLSIALSAVPPITL